MGVILVFMINYLTDLSNSQFALATLLVLIMAQRDVCISWLNNGYRYYITPVLLLSSSDKCIVLRVQCYNTVLLKSMGL